MPDLGKYAVNVIAAYGVSLGILFGFVLLSLWRSLRMKHDLDIAEMQEEKSD